MAVYTSISKETKIKNPLNIFSKVKTISRMDDTLHGIGSKRYWNKFVGINRTNPNGPSIPVVNGSYLALPMDCSVPS